MARFAYDCDVLAQFYPRVGPPTLKLGYELTVRGVLCRRAMLQYCKGGKIFSPLPGTELRQSRTMPA
jgi:hypothetical protein